MGLFGRKRKVYKFTIYHAVPYMSKRTGNIIGGAEFATWVNYLAGNNPDVIHSVLNDFQMVRGGDGVDISRDSVSTITYQLGD